MQTITKILSLALLAGLLTATHSGCAADGAGTPQRSIWARFDSWLDRILGPNNILTVAVKSGNLADVQRALRLGADPNLYISSETHSDNALPESNWTIKLGDHNCVKVSEPALAYCIRYQPNLQIVQALLTAGARINAPITYAFETRSGESLNYTYRTGPTHTLPDLFYVIKFINEPILTCLIAQPLTNDARQRALMMACRLDYTAIVDRLIALGVDVNHLQIDSVLDEPQLKPTILTALTPLMTAVIHNRLEVAKLLLTHGANAQQVVAQSGSRSAPRAYASLQHWPVPADGNFIMQTVLSLALGYDRLELVDLLLAHGAPVNYDVDLVGSVALARSPAVLAHLIAAGADLQAPSSLNRVHISTPNDRKLIEMLLLAGTVVTPAVLGYPGKLWDHPEKSTIQQIYQKLLKNNQQLQRSVAQHKVSDIIRAIRTGIHPVDLRRSLQSLVTEIKTDVIYEIIDSLALNKIDLQIPDELGCTLLDSAILANNYKAVDALLLHGFTEQHLHPDTIPNLLAVTALPVSKSSASGSDTTANWALDHTGNLLCGERRVAMILNWEQAVTQTDDQTCLPNLKVSDLDAMIADRMSFDKAQVLEFAKGSLIMKLLQDSAMAQTDLAATAAAGHDTGFMAGSVPLRYTAVKRRTILETLRMQLAERDSRAAGFQQIAKRVQTAAVDPEFGIEMMPLYGGRKRYAHQADDGGWYEAKDEAE